MKDFFDTSAEEVLGKMSDEEFVEFLKSVNLELEDTKE